MKTPPVLKLFAALLMLCAVGSLTIRAAEIYGPAEALLTGAVAFWLGCHLLDTQWVARPRCATNDISMSGLTELLYQARDTVAREPTGFLQGVTQNGGSEGVSTGGTVNSLRTTQPTLLTSYTPAMTPPNASDITTSTESLTLGSVTGAQIPLKGEAVLQLANTVGFEEALRQLFAQSIRGMVNTIEASVATALKNGSSRAVGTAGTTPFASNFNTINSLRQILQDNGAPMTDGMLSLVIGTSAGVNLRNLSVLHQANTAASDVPLRRGELLNLSGFSIRESAQVASHTAGTGSSATTDNAGYAVGDRTLTLASAGTGTLLAGDVVTFAGDTNKYVLSSGDADVSGGGTLVLNHPGLRVAMSAATKAITVGAAYAANMGFHRSAVEVAMRPPALPPGGDAGEHTVMTDPVTGLSFDVALYRGRGMNMIELVCIYGVKVWKPEFVATLLG